MNVLLQVGLVLNLITSPFTPADFNQLLDDAREAFSAGDMATALDYMDDATELLRGIELEQFLPDPPKGWQRNIVGHGLLATFSNRYGGVDGSAVKAEYVKGDRSIEITFITDRLMISPTGMASDENIRIMGYDVVKIAGHSFIRRGDDLERQSGLVLIWLSGTASLDDKIALAGILDFPAIETHR